MIAFVADTVSVRKHTSEGQDVLMANLQTIKAKAAAADSAQGTGGLLTRKVEAAAQGLMRSKLNPNQKWATELDVDRSGSMGGSYPHDVQACIDRVAGFTLIVDDDGSVPAHFFDHQLQTVQVTPNNFHGIVQRERISARGTTDMTAAIRANLNSLGHGDLIAGGGLFRRGAPAPSKKLVQTPGLVIVIGDGRPNDPGSVEDLIRRASYRAIVFKFIFVGHDEAGWRWLEKLDDAIPVGVSYENGGRLFDNVDSKRFDSLAGLDDTGFYDAMFDELPGALTAMRQNQLLAA